MKRWFWILDTVAVLSFAFIGSDFHGFSFDLLAILVVALPFLLALSMAVGLMMMWRDPISLVSGLLIALTAWSGGMLLRHYVFDDGTARAFVLVTGAYFVAVMVGWRLVVLIVAWIGRRTGSAEAVL